MCSAKHLGGYQAAEKACTIYNLQATILHLLDLDHEKLTYYHNGSHHRRTDVLGHIIEDVLV
jgi:hypothetical protein